MDGKQNVYSISIPVSDTGMKCSSKAADLRMKSSLMNSKKALFDNRLKIRQK